MGKKYALYFVTTTGKIKRTVSQHKKKSRADEVLARLKRQGIKARITKKIDEWVY